MALTVGKRKRGRLEKLWSDCMNEDINSIGAVGEDDVQDRASWRK